MVSPNLMYENDRFFQISFTETTTYHFMKQLWPIAKLTVYLFVAVRTENVMRVKAKPKLATVVMH